MSDKRFRTLVKFEAIEIEIEIEIYLILGESACKGKRIQTKIRDISWVTQKDQIGS